MQKIILDTNVIVSALIQKSYPYYILYEHVIEGNVKVCLSEALIEEYVDVLNRPKFAKFPEFVANSEQVLAYLIKSANLYEPKIKLNLIKDADDNKLLELADESKADFLITGNTNDFTIKQYKNTQILTPKEFWEIQMKI